MEWEGRTWRKKCEGEFRFDDLSEIEVIATVKKEGGIYSFEVRDVNKDGSLSEDYNTLSEWVRTLGWAKRKSNELVPNPISKFAWKKIN